MILSRVELVASFDYSMKLKTHGIDEKSVFYWVAVKDPDTTTSVKNHVLTTHEYGWSQRMGVLEYTALCAAYTIAELYEVYKSLVPDGKFQMMIDGFNPDAFAETIIRGLDTGFLKCQ